MYGGSSGKIWRNISTSGIGGRGRSGVFTPITPAVSPGYRRANGHTRSPPQSWPTITARS